MLDWRTDKRETDLSRSYGTLPARLNFAKSWGDTSNDLYARPFHSPALSKVRNGEPLWGPIDWSDNGGGRTVLAPEVRDELSHFADQLAHGVFAVAPRPNMSFIDMRRVFGNRKGAYFLGTTLLPLCPVSYTHLTLPTICSV